MPHAGGIQQSRNLPLRNMIRDRYTYQLASGQQLAAHLGTHVLDVPDILKAKGITKTPLWFYCLREAELHGGKLGPVGGVIVAVTILRMRLTGCWPSRMPTA